MDPFPAECIVEGDLSYTLYNFWRGRPEPEEIVRMQQYPEKLDSVFCSLRPTQLTDLVLTIKANKILDFSNKFYTFELDDITRRGYQAYISRTASLLASPDDPRQFVILDKAIIKNIELYAGRTVFDQSVLDDFRAKVVAARDAYLLSKK